MLVSTRLEIGNKCTVGLNNTTDCSIRVFDSVCCSVCSIRLVDQLGMQMNGLYSSGKFDLFEYFCYGTGTKVFGYGGPTVL